MFKHFFCSFLILCSFSCGKNSSSHSNTTPGSQTTPLETNEAQRFNVKIQFDKGLSVDEEDKISKAAELIRSVVASEEFKQAILNHEVNGIKSFVDNNGLTNAEIYDKIISGAEELNPEVDHEMDLIIEVYHEDSNTVGHTFPDKIQIWMNSKYLSANPVYKVTTNMMHEWLHKLGFTHAVKNNPRRKDSVPYAIGYLTAQIAAKYQ